MYKKTITYTDYNGLERTEDFYFNISKAELTEMEMSTYGGLEAVISKIIAEKDQKKLTEIFKKLITMTYGEKSEDGKRFMKKKNGIPLYEEFIETEAYSELFMELATDSKAAAEFINGIAPVDISDQVRFNDDGSVDYLNPELANRFGK